MGKTSFQNNKTSDKRNLIDKYKGLSNEYIISDLNKSRTDLQIAIENWSHDFNIGSIIRTSNAFNVNTVHIIGKNNWNKRGAMKTDVYMNIKHYETIFDFIDKMNNITIIGIDIIDNAKPIENQAFPNDCCLLFGSESDGLSVEAQGVCDSIYYITQLGSTRSINAGAAAAIAMYAWRTQQIN